MVPITLIRGSKQLDFSFLLSIIDFNKKSDTGEEPLLKAIDVPQTTAAALSSLARARDALVIGGGTLVMPKVQAGISGLGTLVSLSKLKLDKIAIKGDKVTIGAATTLAAIGEERGLAFLHPAIESLG